MNKSNIRYCISKSVSEWDKIIAEELSDEIDNHIIIDMLMTSAAYKYKHNFDESLLDDINEWCRTNLKNGWRVISNVILIQSENDNNWYILKWT